ncbi:acyl-CoA synthetase FdrA [Craterilacuibacter sp. RT1T]|uniref:acyl-CoA synthetase FdrA n=1 Tax=Craterilacuibacter sp. RT1T TaxID=2942211 RepID=UPI0020C1528C|nr:acyl-CoA synthetase FdrA [Craterilacuibacter sp. RT1T]MCL6264265.1 acyl-CoA synthetase FdrA [Craterilacuibacter sp. RT1T]
MSLHLAILRNQYRDSVALMQLSAALAKLEGITQASAVMATPANLELLTRAGLLADAPDAAPNDLLIALQGDEGAFEAALANARQALDAKGGKGGSGPAALPANSLTMALERQPDSNLALISVPGQYATAEAEKALRAGLNVMLFSDNVSGADERRLKLLATELGRIVMGPDCGTAIIHGVPLAFANVCRQGSIGCVGASGTGLQQVTVLIDRLGEGVSQAIGTGGHDLHASIGGLSMLAGIRALKEDETTRVIVLVSKPPAEDVARAVLDAAISTGKPVVVNFLGADPARLPQHPQLHYASTLQSAAQMAVALVRGQRPADQAPALDAALASGARTLLGAQQRQLRGLYSGGTFCYEATLMLGGALPGLHSNTPTASVPAPDDVWEVRGHSLIDLGDDEFTRGRPHPMIDHRLRNERFIAAAADPAVAVILFDIVLGFGAHESPLEAMRDTLLEVRAMAREAGRTVHLVATVCGTNADPQNYARQWEGFAELGVMLTASNAEAVALARAIVADL